MSYKIGILTIPATHIDRISTDLFIFVTGGFQYAGASNDAAYAHLIDSDLRAMNNSLMWGYSFSISAEGIRVDERPNYWPPNESQGWEIR